MTPNYWVTAASVNLSNFVSFFHSTQKLQQHISLPNSWLMVQLELTFDLCEKDWVITETFPLWACIWTLIFREYQLSSLSQLVSFCFCVFVFVNNWTQNNAMSKQRLSRRVKLILILTCISSGASTGAHRLAHSIHSQPLYLSRLNNCPFSALSVDILTRWTHFQRK
jgi:hypothetical protein